ncbi:MAG: toxic anion resistance protein [Xanthomonadales bacterium]|nr:toxic anion resistance protein [Xanthomonadales bacterium]
MSNAESAGGFQLTPPEVIQPVGTQVARSAVPLSASVRTAVDDQVERFLEGLLREDVQGEEFQQRLGSAFTLGREEISVAASLMQGRLLQANFVGMEDQAAFKAIQEMRRHLDSLNPGREGDLLQPQKLLGIIPFGNRLQAYFRKYQSAAAQLQASLQQLYAARDEMQRDVLEIEATRTRLWEAMQKLAAAIHFTEQLDTALQTRLEILRMTDPLRAKALEQEVLYYVRQNLQDMLTQQAVCSNGYLALDVLKKTGREMMNGCTRIATTGMSALAVAQTVARATGNQIRVMDMLSGVNQSIGTLVSETGRQLNTHVERTAAFGQNPTLGIEQLKDMFEQTFQAMDAMDQFRATAIDVMGQNNAIIREQVARTAQYLDRERRAQARAATRNTLAGPVAL